MWFRGITGCILPVFYMYFTIRLPFGLGTVQVSFTLLGYNVFNLSFMGFKIIAECISIKSLTTLGKYRLTGKMTCGVRCSCSKSFFGTVVKPDVIAGQSYVLVINNCFIKQVNLLKK
jgi:hypothetical protein